VHRRAHPQATSKPLGCTTSTLGCASDGLRGLSGASTSWAAAAVGTPAQYNDARSVDKLPEGSPGSIESCQGTTRKSTSRGNKCHPQSLALQSVQLCESARS